MLFKLMGLPICLHNLISLNNICNIVPCVYGITHLINWNNLIKQKMWFKAVYIYNIYNGWQSIPYVVTASARAASMALCRVLPHSTMRLMTFGDGEQERL